MELLRAKYCAKCHKNITSNSQNPERKIETQRYTCVGLKRQNENN